LFIDLTVIGVPPTFSPAFVWLFYLSAIHIKFTYLIREYFMTAEKFVRKSLKPLIKRLFKSKKSSNHWEKYRKSKTTK